MTKTCAVCSGVSPDVKFSREHKTCNKCRNAKSRDYRREYARKRHASRTDEERRQRADQTRQYRATRPHVTFYMTSRYQANKAGVISDLTHDDALSIYEMPNVCAYCDKEIDVSVKRALHIDHIIPMSQGGPNSRWNLVKTCISCNTSKGDGSLTDFYERTPDFTSERYRAVISGMTRLSNRSTAEIDELLTLSHAFEIAHERERQRMLGALNVLTA